MSIVHKDISVVKKKSKEVKDKKEFKLGYPPANTKESMPGFVWGMQELTGTENAYYDYKDKKNKRCFFVRRYEPWEKGNDSSKKRITPYSYDLLTGCWVTVAWKKDRPLFHENYLRKDRDILIPEGEKTVLAAMKHFPDYDCVTWSGGSKAVSKSTFESLKDRRVILFPDNDKAGELAMHEVAKILIEENITDDVHLVELPKDLPSGWDLADQIAIKGMTYQGILDTQREYDPEEHTKIWEKLNERKQKKEVEDRIEGFLHMYVYIRSLTSFYELPSKQIISKEMINDWNMQYTTKGPPMSTKLLSDPGMEKVYSVLTHAGLPPGKITVKRGQFEAINEGTYYNTYIPTNIISKPGDVTALIEYYKWFVGDNWKIIEQFIAFMIKYPGVKMRWACVFTSKEGGGKGLLASLISALLGHHNCNTQVEFDQMITKHSNVLLGTQFAIINELDLESKGKIKSNTNKLKKYITDNVLTIELKNKPQIKIPNFCNFFIYSNQDDCLYLTKEARRYFITTIKHEQLDIEKKLEEDGYKDLILDALEYGSEELCHLKHYFENVEITDKKIFQRNAPKTQDFYDIVEKSRQGIHRALDDRFHANLYPFENNGAWSTTVRESNGIYKNGELTNPTRTTAHYCFSGLVIAEELLAVCRLDKLLSKEHISRDLIIEWCKEKSIPWKRTDKNGIAYVTDQKQIVMTGRLTKRTEDLGSYSHAIKKMYPKAYLLHDFVVEGKKLSTMTEGELGQHHMTYSYHRMIIDHNLDRHQHEIREDQLPLTPDINKPSVC